MSPSKLCTQAPSPSPRKSTRKAVRKGGALSRLQSTAEEGPVSSGETQEGPVSSGESKMKDCPEPNRV